jgi:hypothetical protein
MAASAGVAAATITSGFESTSHGCATAHYDSCHTDPAKSIEGQSSSNKVWQQEHACHGETDCRDIPWGEARAHAEARYDDEGSPNAHGGKAVDRPPRHNREPSPVASVDSAIQRGFRLDQCLQPGRKKTLSTNAEGMTIRFLRLNSRLRWRHSLSVAHGRLWRHKADIGDEAPMSAVGGIADVPLASRAYRGDAHPLTFVDQSPHACAISHRAITAGHCDYTAT